MISINLTKYAGSSPSFRCQDSMSAFCQPSLIAGKLTLAQFEKHFQDEEAPQGGCELILLILFGLVRTGTSCIEFIYD